MKKILAQVFSRLLDPVWEIPLALLLAIGFAVKEGLRWRFVGLLLFIDALVPTIFFLTMLYNRQIRDWDIQNRAQRIPLYLFTLLCHLGGLWLAYAMGKYALFHALLVIFIGISLFVVITFFWKISLHALSNAGIITALVLLFGWRYVPLYGLLLGVMWARVYQKHHTWSQVILGALLGTIITWLGMLRM
jgi:membrane-associated phospholipid phosphatase